MACSLALVGLACGVCSVESFCSALVATFGKKEVPFPKAEKHCTAQ